MRPSEPESGSAFLRQTLKPLYFGRVVAGGDHHAAVVAEFTDRKIEAVGGNQAEVDDIDTADR